VTTKTVPEPERYSVEYYVGLLHRHAPDEKPQAFALRMIGTLAYADYLEKAERFRRIGNVLAAAAVVQGMPVGLDYSRVDDDPQVIRPHSPRLPLHTGAVTDQGLVEVTRVECGAQTFDGADRLYRCTALPHPGSAAHTWELAPGERRVEAASVACSDECQARPEEWPCLDDCPAQRAARGES
jgi:hypothetical protein